jgi:SAM-dependent methyltransferase
MTFEFLSAILRRIRSRAGSGSSAYRILTGPPTAEPEGWHSAETAHGQHRAFEILVQDAKAGLVRIDFESAVRAVELTGIENPTVLDVGCGTAYYSEVFASLYRRPLRYFGFDVSAAMILLARQRYPNARVGVADARCLPLPPSSCDVVFNGGALMHIVGTEAVVAESVRVARSWCIFHTVPVVERRPTIWLQKTAYAGEVVEVIFNRQEIESIFHSAGLVIHTVLDNIFYDVSKVVGAPTTTLTYVCSKL